MDNKTFCASKTHRNQQEAQDLCKYLHYSQFNIDHLDFDIDARQIMYSWSVLGVRSIIFMIKKMFHNTRQHHTYRDIKGIFVKMGH